MPRVVIARRRASVRAGPAGARRRRSRRLPERRCLRLVVPHRLQDDGPARRPGPRGRPAGRRPSRRGRPRRSPARTPASRSQTPVWNSPKVSSSGTVQPSPMLGREVVRAARPRSAARRPVLLRVDDLLGGGRAVGRTAASTAAQPPSSWMPWTKARPVLYGNSRLSVRMAGVRSRTAVDSGSCPAARTSWISSGRQVGDRATGTSAAWRHPRSRPPARAPRRSGRGAPPGRRRRRSWRPGARGRTRGRRSPCPRR